MMKLHFFLIKTSHKVRTSYGRKIYFSLELFFLYWKVLTMCPILVKKYQWWRACWEKNRTRRPQSRISFYYCHHYKFSLTLSWWRPLSYIIYLQNKSMDWFLYDNTLRHKRVKMERHTFTAVVKRYHCYLRLWQPKGNEKLVCIYEAWNSFDRFVIKALNKRGEIAGHLPKEISIVTKYFLDRGLGLIWSGD